MNLISQHAANSPDTIVGILFNSILGSEACKVDLEFTARTSRNGPINLEVTGKKECNLIA